jgi:hypothetical protein
MSEESTIDVKPSPAPSKPPATEVALLQGGPCHMRSVRVQVGDDECVQDMGNKQAATYRRRPGGDSPAGAPFDYVIPPNLPEGITPA